MKRAEEEVGYLAALALNRANDPRNVAKGDWPRSHWRLFGLLVIEVWELFRALQCLAGIEAYWRLRGRITDEGVRSIKKARAHVKHEAGDCCTFLAYLVNRL